MTKRKKKSHPITKQNNINPLKKHLWFNRLIAALYRTGHHFNGGILIFNAENQSRNILKTSRLNGKLN